MKVMKNFYPAGFIIQSGFPIIVRYVTSVKAFVSLLRTKAAKGIKHGSPKLDVRAFRISVCGLFDCTNEQVLLI